MVLFYSRPHVSFSEADFSLPQPVCRSLLYCTAHAELVDVWVQLRGVSCTVDSLLRCITPLQVQPL